MNISQFRSLLADHQKAAPVHVVPIAKALGVPVFRVNGWSDDVSGRIYQTDDDMSESGYAIDVNANHAITRRRFTIAHEIAHFVLHRERIGHEMYDDHMYRSGLPERMEWEANGLAADILMPRHLVLKSLSEHQGSASKMAFHFEVSEQAMKIRLENLGVRYVPS